MNNSCSKQHAPWLCSSKPSSGAAINKEANERISTCVHAACNENHNRDQNRVELSVNHSRFYYFRTLSKYKAWCKTGTSGCGLPGRLRAGKPAASGCWLRCTSGMAFRRARTSPFATMRDVHRSLRVWIRAAKKNTIISAKEFILQYCSVFIIVSYFGIQVQYLIIKLDKSN